MWLFTRRGFFSVVADIDHRSHVLVRARDRRHLRYLRWKFPKALRRTPIQATPSADYPFRLSLPRKVWASVAADLAREVTYGNFKAEAGRREATLGPAHVDALHDVWYRMRQVEP